MKTKLLALVLLAAGALFAGPRVYVGIGVGGYARPYYAPAPVVAYAAPLPGPGYWYGVGPHRYWHAGYLAPRPYVRGYRVAPAYRYGYRR